MLDNATLGERPPEIASGLEVASAVLDAGSFGSSASEIARIDAAYADATATSDPAGRSAIGLSLSFMKPSKGSPPCFHHAPLRSTRLDLTPEAFAIASTAYLGEAAVALSDDRVNGTPIRAPIAAQARRSGSLVTPSGTGVPPPPMRGAASWSRVRWASAASESF